MTATVTRRRRLLAASAIVVGVVGAGVASGALPGGPTDSPDAFYACMAKGGPIWPTTIRKGSAPRACPFRTDTVVSWSGAAGAGPAGPAGPAGKDGRDGTNGTDGRDGTNGTDGRDGTNGTDGRDGASILTGSGAPPADVGHDGDLYLDTDGTVLYGPKADGAWPSEGVSLIGPAGPAGPEGPQGPPGPPATTVPDPTSTTTTQPEQTLFTVILVNGGGNKLAVVKVVKDLTGLGLKEAKDLVDLAPQVVKAGISKVEAEDIKKQLTEAGAEVRVE